MTSQALDRRIAMAPESPHSFRDYLLGSAAEIGVEAVEFCPLADDEASVVAEVEGKRFGSSIRFLWWCPDGPPVTPSAAHQFQDDQGWAELAHIAPNPNEPVWLIAENWYSERPAYFVFEGTPAVIQRVLGNSLGFEYVVVSKRLEWLIAEDDHSVVQVVGSPVVGRLTSAHSRGGGDIS